jgi:Uma2 family endonuclease
MSTSAKFTLEEFDRMIKLGLFDPPYDRRIELIHGELTEMNPPGPLHEDVIDILTRWSFENVDKAEIRVRIQNSIGLPESDSAPQPDVCWVKAKSYSEQRPRAEDVLLVIEVADSSLVGDQRVKAGVYAQAGIPEYWIINLPHWCVECHRDPVGATYQTIQRYNRQESLSPLAAPGAILVVRDLFSS